jgi:hypothetical protein
MTPENTTTSSRINQLYHRYYTICRSSSDSTEQDIIQYIWESTVYIRNRVYLSSSSNNNNIFRLIKNMSSLVRLQFTPNTIQGK